MTALVLLGGGLAAIPASAFMREPDDRAAEGLIDRAVGGDSAAAFAAADAMRSPDDAALATALKQQQAAFDTRRATLTDPGHASLIEDSHLGPCVHRTYLVRYAQTKQFWRLSYRHMSTGWHLSELVVSE